jgi:segregation and condensation protein B
MEPASPSADDNPEQKGISLQELTDAFARAMGYGATSEGAPPQAGGVAAVGEAQTVPAPATVAQPADVAPAPPEPPCPVSPASILEAMLFVGNRDHLPISAAQAADLMRGVEPDEIPGLVDALNGRYAAGGCPYEIVSQSGGYRLALRREYDGLRSRFYGRVREARLSQAAVDVLAIVAYQQPITADEIHRLRGKPASRILAQMVRRGLLQVQRSAGPPKTVHYRTAGRFLELFGLDSLDDLPKSEDLD